LRSSWEHREKLILAVVGVLKLFGECLNLAARQYGFRHLDGMDEDTVNPAFDVPRGLRDEVEEPLLEAAVAERVEPDGVFVRDEELAAVVHAIRNVPKALLGEFRAGLPDRIYRRDLSGRKAPRIGSSQARRRGPDPVGSRWLPVPA
jgi:hypothetical protein